MGIHVRMDSIVGIDMAISGVLDYTKPKRFIVAKEDPGDNPHVHMYLDSEKTRDDVRNFITRKYPQWKKDHKCVKKWGDEDADLRYFCKGNKKGVWQGVNISHTSFSFDTIVRLNREFYENAPKKNDRTLTQWLTERCRLKGIKDEFGIIQEFIDSRKGKEGICPFKHGPVIRSAFCELNGTDAVFEMSMRFREKIFGF